MQIKYNVYLFCFLHSANQYLALKPKKLRFMFQWMCSCIRYQGCEKSIAVSEKSDFSLRNNSEGSPLIENTREQSFISLVVVVAITNPLRTFSENKLVLLILKYPVVNGANQ